MNEWVMQNDLVPLTYTYKGIKDKQHWLYPCQSQGTFHIYYNFTLKQLSLVALVYSFVYLRPQN